MTAVAAVFFLFLCVRFAAALIVCALPSRVRAFLLRKL
jgi:hypothetical protein